MKARLVHAIAGFVVSISSAAYSWFQAHGSTVATVIAVVAGLYSIHAARRTIALRNKQIESLNRATTELDRLIDL